MDFRDVIHVAVRGNSWASDPDFFRGNSWAAEPSIFRVGERYFFPPRAPEDFIGFRLFRPAQDNKHPD